MFALLTFMPASAALINLDFSFDSSGDVNGTILGLDNVGVSSATSILLRIGDAEQTITASRAGQ